MDFMKKTLNHINTQENTLYDLIYDLAFFAALQESEDDIKNGRVYTLEEMDAEMEEIVGTCKFLGVHELIEKSPDGYDSYLIDDYHNFSDGEGKLICVARVLISNPKILILNYPNYLSVEKLKTICEGKTSIILTPDETCIDFADKTINLDDL